MMSSSPTAHSGAGRLRSCPRGSSEQWRRRANPPSLLTPRGRAPATQEPRFLLQDVSELRTYCYLGPSVPRGREEISYSPGHLESAAWAPLEGGQLPRGLNAGPQVSAGGQHRRCYTPRSLRRPAEPTSTPWQPWLEREDHPCLGRVWFIC